ncbi:hypothetical protein SGFS_011210 [Streptomyces graminofaciens]|uniref:Uncharacterized protein n=1 Tax=Streptomyces graminofaciens TaxID=68212 RepID=A0ABN5V9A7_9ACTN|nr:hypothetical protein [Streptomyces graminofaciens]BBC29827.1 hypothetical protein SGFS_011210 [Streptomyces graminofaciens]
MRWAPWLCPGIHESDAERRRTARTGLASWLSGDHSGNNTYR